MDKQSTIAFILIGVILVFWLYLNAPDPNTVPQQVQDSTTVTKNLPADNEKLKEEKLVTEN